MSSLHVSGMVCDVVVVGVSLMMWILKEVAGNSKLRMYRCL